MSVLPTRLELSFGVRDDVVTAAENELLHVIVLGFLEDGLEGSEELPLELEES